MKKRERASLPKKEISKHSLWNQNKFNCVIIIQITLKSKQKTKVLSSSRINNWIVEVEKAEEGDDDDDDDERKRKKERETNSRTR